MIVTKISAIALTVADIDLSIRFYTQALEFKVVEDCTFEPSSYDRLASIPESRVRLVTLQLGEEYIELIQYLDLEAKPIPKDSQSNDLWFQHLAIVVKDIDRAYQHLQKFEIKPISKKPQTIPQDNKLAAGVRAFKFRELDHHSLELIWFPPGKGKDRWQHSENELFLGIDHSAIAVRDTEKSLRFYRDLLGLTPAKTNLNQGQEQADLDNLSAPELEVTPLQPKESSIGVELLAYQQPQGGRERSQDWQINDLPHLHYLMEVDDLADIEELKPQVDFISPKAIAKLAVGIALPNLYRYDRGCLIADPDGHAVLLVQ
ncbi:MAG: VOC family protein [Cyanobacteria bacterium J06635_13]